MKAIGILILASGLALGVYALTMNVGVDVPAQVYGYGIETPAMQVANVDRMAQRQNLLIFSGILAVVGAILTGFASMRPTSVTPPPQSSEPLPSLTVDPAPAETPLSVSICPKCRSMTTGDAAACGRCGFSLATDQ